MWVGGDELVEAETGDLADHRQGVVGVASQEVIATETALSPASREALTRLRWRPTLAVQ